MLFLTHNQTFPFFAVSTHVFLIVYHCIYIQLGVPLLNRKSIARPSQTMHHEGTGYVHTVDRSPHPHCWKKLAHNTLTDHIVWLASQTNVSRTYMSLQAVNNAWNGMI